MTSRLKPIFFGTVLAVGATGAALAQSAAPVAGPPSTDVIDQTAGAPGPYAAWPVLSNDNVQVGTVSFSAETTEGKVPFIVVKKADGHEFKLTNGISVIPNAISINLSKAQVDAFTVDRFTNIVLP